MRQVASEASHRRAEEPHFLLSADAAQVKHPRARVDAVRLFSASRLRARGGRAPEPRGDRRRAAPSAPRRYRTEHAKPAQRVVTDVTAEQPEPARRQHDDVEEVAERADDHLHRGRAKQRRL
eukprot:5924719-Pleurochrysis_carterae.AAC.1